MRSLQEAVSRCLPAGVRPRGNGRQQALLVGRQFSTIRTCGLPPTRPTRCELRPRLHVKARTASAGAVRTASLELDKYASAPDALLWRLEKCKRAEHLREIGRSWSSRRSSEAGSTEEAHRVYEERVSNRSHTRRDALALRESALRTSRRSSAYSPD